MPRPSAGSSSLCGLIVVDKPVGPSSMDVVRRVRRAAGGAKTGHAGTLDPLASGVVVCCLGRATRCVEQLMGLTKVYEAAVDLSAFTTTDDREGERVGPQKCDPPPESALRDRLESFIGHIEQTPPVYSAVHVNGQRAYKMARRGETVRLKARTVRIDTIQLLGYDWPIAQLRVTCGRGTYLRSLARDLGEALGTGGHLAALRRAAVGQYDLARAVIFDRLDSPITQEDLLEPPAIKP